MVKKEYQKLKEKYKLPSYADLDRAFDISSIEPDGKLLREIKKNVKEAFDKVLSFLGGMLQPESGDVVAFYEYKCFSDDDRTKSFKLLHRLLVISRKHTETVFAQDDVKDADFINEAYHEWEAIRKELVPYTQKLQEYWKEDHEEKEIQRYLG